MTSEDFFKEFNRLLKSYPNPPLRQVSVENCEYSDYVSNSKNLTYCFDTYRSSDCYFTYDCFLIANCGDCDYTVESELCYESVDAFKCFNCTYIEDCARMRDSDFCYDSMDCNNCFGCVRLRGKSYCLFNRQLTEDEYRREIQKYKILPPEKVLAMVEELKKRFPKTVTHSNDANVNTNYGNYIYYDKNCYMCFDAARNEDSAYLYDSFDNKKSFDGTYSGVYSELCYEIVDGRGLFNCNYCIDVLNCQDSSYLYFCNNVKNSLGCINLTNKQFCILNRQFTKEEYERISSQILDDIRNKNLGWADIAI